jgi:hypothetical protein
VGDQIAIVFDDQKGVPGERIFIPIAEYVSAVSSRYVARNRLGKQSRQPIEQNREPSDAGHSSIATPDLRSS